MSLKRKAVVKTATAVPIGHDKRSRNTTVAVIHAREVGLKQPPGVMDPEWEKMYMMLRTYIAKKHLSLIHI